jgi:hypothetical protein
VQSKVWSTIGRHADEPLSITELLLRPDRQPVLAYHLTGARTHPADASHAPLVSTRGARHPPDLRDLARLVVSTHQLVRRYGGRREEIDLVANDEQRAPIEFTEPGTVEPVRPATDGLVRLSEAAVASGFHIVELTVEFPSGDPNDPALEQIESDLIESLTSGDLNAASRILNGREHPVVVSVKFRAPNRDVLRLTRGGAVELTPRGPNPSESLSYVLNSARRLLGRSPQ